MFLWRKILSTICLVCCFAPLFAQEIDYSKCSCDSIARYFTTKLSNTQEYSNFDLKDTTIKNFVNGFEREIIVGKIHWYLGTKSQTSYGLIKCTYKKEGDSIIVKYSIDNITQAQGAQGKFRFGEKYLAYYYHDEHIIDPTKKGRGIRHINFATDSIIYKINKVSYYVFSYFPFAKFVHEEYKFNLINERHININGADSVIYRYYLPDELFYYGLTKNEINKIKHNYEPILFAKYGPLGRDVVLHGEYLAFDYKGKRFMEINYSNGVIHGKYFYEPQVFTGQKGDYDKGQYFNGKKSGRWVYKRGSAFSMFPKKYIIKYDENGKPKNAKIAKNNRQTLKRMELNDSGDIYELNPIFFNLYDHFYGSGYPFFKKVENEQ